MSDKLPPIVEAWIKQISDPAIHALLQIASDGRIDIKLSSSKGKVSRLPEITFNGGVQEQVAPSNVINLLQN